MLRPDASIRENASSRVLPYVIRGAMRNHAMATRPFLGLPRSEFEYLVRFCFPSSARKMMVEACTRPRLPAERHDEFKDLVSLLLEYRCDDSPLTRWVAHATAAACMGENHLWQDMGLPDRASLNRLMNSFFPGLAARNTGHMRWKKFFYRQLCEREGLNICKSPSCGICVDYRNCFAPEDDQPFQPETAATPSA